MTPFDPNDEDALNDLYHQIEQLDDRDRGLLAMIVVQSLKDDTFLRLMEVFNMRASLIRTTRG